MASESDSQRADSGRPGRMGKLPAGPLDGDDRLGMILASAALHAATERGIGLLEILASAARGLADILGANHIAATHDHESQSMLLRITCK